MIAKMITGSKLATALVLLATLMGGLPAWAHPGAIITVNDLGDNLIAGDGKCTLREAIENAAYQADHTLGDCAPGLDNETIVFSVNGTITLVEGYLFLDGDLTIDGSGHSITLSGGGNYTILVGDGSHHIIKNLTLANGYATVNIGLGIVGGGAIVASGKLDVMNCHFEDNFSRDYGGAIAAADDVTIINSTFNANAADKRGGAVYGDYAYLTISGSTFTDNTVLSGSDFGGGAVAAYHPSGGGLDVTGCTFKSNGYIGGGAVRTNTAQNFVTNSTFYTNWAGVSGLGAVLRASNATYVTNSTLYFNLSSGGGSLYNDGGELVVRNSIMHGNSCSSGNITDGGFNIAFNSSFNCPGIDVGPGLSDLADNGGPTQTIALLSGSPAINAGEPSICRNVVVGNTDQRGRMRISGSDTQCDIGAYESNASATATPTATPTNTPFNPDGWIYCVEEHDTCRFNGLARVRYGAGATYTEKTLTAPVPCDNSIFGDPAYLVFKHCDIKIIATPTPTPPGTPVPDLEGWERCAVENGTCNWSGTKYIRYGVPGAYTTRMMTASAPCNNATFGDPIYGVVKHCDLHTIHTPTPTSTPSATPTPH